MENSETAAEPSAEPSTDHSTALLQQLGQLLGEGGVRTQPDAVMPDVILRPRTTAEVSAVLRLC